MDEGQDSVARPQVAQELRRNRVKQTKRTARNWFAQRRRKPRTVLCRKEDRYVSSPSSPQDEGVQDLL